MRGPARRTLPAVDPLVASPARVYALLLGDGSWSFESDHRAVEQLLDVEPMSGELSQQNRLFVNRAARWVAGQGVRQFCDLGAGLPVTTFPSVHEVVRSEVTDAWVAYIDNDPVVFQGLASTLTEEDNAAAILGDLRDPGQVLRDMQEAGFDPAAPVCLIFGAVCHFLPADHARAIVRRYADLAAPGSYLVISVARADGEHAARLRRAYRAASTFTHGRDEIAAWMTGLDLVPPGMSQAQEWIPGRRHVSLPVHGGEMWCGVARTSSSEPPVRDAEGTSEDGTVLPGGQEAGTLPHPGWDYADRLLRLLDGTWAPVVLRYLPAEAPGARPAELRASINDGRAENEPTISKTILLKCLGRMVAQGLVERTDASTDTPVTFYRLTDEGQYALATLRRLAGAGRVSWLAQPPLEDPGFDPAKPSIARIYDYWLGGKDSFLADREQASALANMFPALPMLARENRAFLKRAVPYTASQGIGQFIDLGAGLPTTPAVHELARGSNPGAQVLYVDNDLSVVRHASVLLAADGVGAAIGDIADPEAILASPELNRLIDLREPACLILALVLHYFPPDQADRIVSTFTSALVPGSYLILSLAGSRDQGFTTAFNDIYTAGKTYRHSIDQVAGYLSGFDLIDGLTEARYWHAEPPAVPADDRPVIVCAAVGRKRA